jgi:hypothetical protein
MANKNKKGRKPDWEEEDDIQPVRKSAPDGEDLDESNEAADADDGELDLAAISESVTPQGSNEPDPGEVDNLTDRIFTSVLSRFGWERHGSRIEHVGEERQRNRR